MAPRPTAERPPSGLDSYWTHVWDHALQVLKRQGTWDWELKPLLDEYVFALRGAQATRDGFEWLERLEAGDEVEWQVLKQIAGSGPAQWDRHVKRAQALADQLALTPRGRKAVGIVDDESEDADPFADLDPRDELAQRRRSA